MGLSLEEFLQLPGCEAQSRAQASTAQAFGSRVELCAIVNILSGPCQMDCAFCGQNCHSAMPSRGLPEEAALLRRIADLAATPVAHIGLVAAGGALGQRDLDRLCHMLARLPQDILSRICLSLGRLSCSQLQQLRQLGLKRYHHNLEVSREFYPQVCRTQSWDARARTVQAALDLGLEVCSGAIFGVGESWHDRVTLARSLEELGVQYIPLNFLHPQPGTRLGNRPPLEADEALRCIGLFRAILPRATLRVCGGRPITFGERQGEIFSWGANALMTGDYLTTRGEALQSDLRLLAEHGLEAWGC